MSKPDFSKITIETIAKRARYQCSNPDCGISTVGPNSDSDKATVIGEAAHIMGAKPGSKRFDKTMSDTTRAAITNGIWLCRNCHGLIDRDEMQYPAALLFAWRESQEERAARELGSKADKIRYETERASLEFLSPYPPIIQRIAIDKPEGWEWRFTSELMKHLNRPHFRRLKNLKAGRYFKAQPKISDHDFLAWVSDRSYVMKNLVGPLASLFDHLPECWGAPGEPGDLEDIYDTCTLIGDLLLNIVEFEESLRFANIPTEGEELRMCLTNCIGDNAARLVEFPSVLDKVVSMIGTDHGGTVEQPTMITYTLAFDLPYNVNDRFDAALAKYKATLFA